MDPKDAEDLCNTGPEDETVVRERKRLRRVSFAEITSVHVFVRDEEYETPPDSKPNSETTPDSAQKLKDEQLGFQKYVADRNDESNSEEDEDMREPFVRNMEYSSSPGSASATSNDEDNFFGPVSASFIRSGQESTSATSDYCQEDTMDSTAFSMHYRSLVPSDSEGNFKTPTEVDFISEDKTPFENFEPISSGSSMVLTKVKKPIPRWSSSGGNSSGDSGSNNMSFVESNPSKYDYGKLSPRLGALLAESSKDIDNISASKKRVISKSPSNFITGSRYPTLSEHRVEQLQLKECADNELRNLGTRDVSSTEVVCYDNTKAMVGLASTHVDHNSCDGSEQLLNVDEFSNGSVKAWGDKLEVGSGKDDDPVTPLNNTFQMGLTVKSDGYVGQIGDSELGRSPEGESLTPLICQTTNQHPGLPLERSVSVLCAKRQDIFVDDAFASSDKHVATPFGREQSSFLNRRKINHTESIESIRKSISRFIVHKNSPMTSASNLGHPTSFSTLLDENSNDRKLKQGVISVTLQEEHSSRGAMKNNQQKNRGETERFVVEAPKNIRVSEEYVTAEHNKESSCGLSSGFLSSVEAGEFIASVFPSYQVPVSWKDIRQHPLTSNGRVFVTTENDSSLLDIRYASKDDHATNTHCNFDHIPLERLEQMSASLREKGVIVGASYDLDQYVTLANLEQGQKSADVRENNNNKKRLTPMTEDPIKMVCSLNENRTHAPLTSLDISSDGIINSGKSEALGNGECLHPNYLKESAKVGNYLTPLKGSTNPNPPSAMLDLSLQTWTDPTKLGKKVPERASLYKSASPQCRKRPVAVTRFQKIFTNFSGSMEGMCLPLCGKLDRLELDNLEDMLDRVQRAKKYENLCNLFQLQRTHDQPGNLLQKRTAEAKCLQEAVIYEKAKMQLLLMKKEQLLKKLEFLQSGIQKSQNLKSSLKNVFARSARNAKSQFPSVSVDSCSKNEEAHSKVITKRQELGALDQEMTDLTKSILASCKIKGEQNPSETVLLVNEHLRKRGCCRLIQKELQLWEVDNLENKNGHHSLVLNYGHFLFQRFTVNHSSVSTIATLKKLDNANITKSFPNMNACTAFAFVFNAEGARGLRSPKSLAVETQITSSLFGNLLDVVEEVQAARIELRHLTLTSFESPGVGLLELRLCFINFNTGDKVTLTLDMTCLNRGIYPSKILPRVSVTQSSQPLQAAIEAAVGALGAGYSKVLRLCRRVQQIVQASNT